MLPAPRSLLFALALAALWLPIIYLLSPQWAVYEQYSYGWAVPLLCLYLVWRRWRTWENAEISKPETLKSPSPPISPALLSAFLLFLLLLLLPTRILQEASPFWRLASYALAFDAIAITLLLVSFAGGFRAAKHFAFPVCFFLIAVPWPTPLELFVVQNLTRFNTHVVTEVMNGLGIAALAHGNVIEVSTGMLGIEEACSGIRSLQAVLMLALFFGELHRLTVFRRVALLVAGLATALLLNILRTAILVFMAARHSIDFSNRWHDTTGTVVLVACFGAVWAIGRMLRLCSVPSEAAGPMACITPAQVPRQLLWSVIICSAISVIGSELWFRRHEHNHAAAEQWTITLPRERLGFRNNELAPGVIAALQYDAGRSAVWQNDDGTHWQMFHFRWNPATTLNDRVRVHLAKSHRPEACLPAGGWKLRTEFPATSVEISGLSLVFRTYDFAIAGRSVFVFFCVREDGSPSGSAANMRETHAARFRAAWEGNRGLGQRVIEIAISGARNLAEAEASLRRELPQLIHIQGRPR